MNSIMILFLPAATGATGLRIFAYIGPGAGLSAIGAFVALVAVFGLIFVGFVWFPLKRLRRRLRDKSRTAPPSSASSPHEAGGPDAR